MDHVCAVVFELRRCQDVKGMPAASVTCVHKSCRNSFAGNVVMYLSASQSSTLTSESRLFLSQTQPEIVVQSARSILAAKCGRGAAPMRPEKISNPKQTNWKVTNTAAVRETRPSRQ